MKQLPLPAGGFAVDGEGMEFLYVEDLVLDICTFDQGRSRVGEVGEQAWEGKHPLALTRYPGWHLCHAAPPFYAP